MKFFLVLLVVLLIFAGAVFYLRKGNVEKTDPTPPKKEEPFPEAAILKKPYDKPALKEEDLKKYDEARRVVIVNPRKIGTYLGTFRRDPSRWKRAMIHMASTDPFGAPRAFALRVLIRL